MQISFNNQSSIFLAYYTEKQFSVISIYMLLAENVGLSKNTQ